MEKKIEEQFNKKFTDYPGGVYSGEKPARKEDILDFVETICQQERERMIEEKQNALIDQLQRFRGVLGKYNCQHGGRECEFQINCHRLIEEELKNLTIK